MIVIHSFDGQKEEIRAASAREIIPYNGLLISSQVRAPYAAILFYRDSLLPVHGPLPQAWDADASYEERPWILVCVGYARVIRGLPHFLDAARKESDALRLTVEKALAQSRSA